MKRRTRNPPDFLTKWAHRKEEAIASLVALRAEVLGPNTGANYLAWTDTLPEHPRSARERFLQIAAVGGPIPFEALAYKLVAQPHRRFRNWWHLMLKGPTASTLPHLEMWTGSRKNVVELYAPDRNFPPRAASCAFFTGTLAECLQRAHDHLAVEDASQRLDA